MIFISASVFLNIEYFIIYPSHAHIENIQAFVHIKHIIYYMHIYIIMYLNIKLLLNEANVKRIAYSSELRDIETYVDTQVSFIR